MGVRFAYDFGRIGASGLTGRFSFANGVDAINPKNGKAEPNEREYDFDVIYAPSKRWLDGFSFRVRVGLVQQAGVSGLLPDIRLVMRCDTCSEIVNVDQVLSCSGKRLCDSQGDEQRV